MGLAVKPPSNVKAEHARVTPSSQSISYLLLQMLASPTRPQRHTPSKKALSFMGCCSVKSGVNDCLWADTSSQVGQGTRVGSFLACLSLEAEGWMGFHCMEQMHAPSTC